MPGESALGGASTGQRNNGVGNPVGSGVVDAAHSTGEVDDAVGLSALENGEALQGPVVDDLAHQ